MALVSRWARPPQDGQVVLTQSVALASGGCGRAFGSSDATGVKSSISGNSSGS